MWYLIGGSERYNMKSAVEKQTKISKHLREGSYLP